MGTFEQTGIWQRTLARRQGSEAEEKARETLRNALAGDTGFRARAAMLGQLIHVSYPTLTTHDVTHLDALWEMADLILGDDYPLNPAEAFVLGGAFLTHDLGNGLAAYPLGMEQLRATSEWRDAAAARIRRAQGRAPTSEELRQPLSDPRLEQQALEDTLRALHARQAEKLALISWKGSRDEPLYLLENSDLRAHFGRLIGEIAHSHWWDVQELERKFARRRLGSHPSLPNDWTVDALKVASILRVADAAHLDLRRAPPFLMAVVRPEGISKAHWTFQSKLSTPTLRHDRLLYTSGTTFRRDEAGAFWLGFDTLRMVDRELRDVDALLSSNDRSRFEARGVVGADDPLHLATHIPTEDWTPVDARIQVTDVPSLVARLGGRELYGDEPIVPLRELLQNAADAIRARRVIQKRERDWGTITVRTGEDAHGTWLEVEDTGLGMSQRLLTHHLLDFGRSYWGSEDMRREHPGLLASDFAPTGRFGIGFFAVFMWGKRLHVASRPCVEGERTRVLEFDNGLGTRPLLRPAEPEEQVRDGGTRVRVWLSSPEILARMLHSKSLLPIGSSKPRTLAELVARMAPTLDVSTDVQVSGQVADRVVTANDWETLPAVSLLERLGVEDAESIAPMVRPLYDEQRRCLGRGCFAGIWMDIKAKSFGGLPVAAITVGGMYAAYQQGMLGVLLGGTDVAARDEAWLLAGRSDIARWSTDQARLWESNEGPTDKESIGLSVLNAGGDPGRLPLAWHLGRALTAAEVREFAKERDEVVLVMAVLPSLLRQRIRETQLRDTLEIQTAQGRERWNLRIDDHLSPGERIGRLIAEAWGISVEQALVEDDSRYVTKNKLMSVPAERWVFRRPATGSAPASGPH